jgi:iron complex transport system substrate-binding protein
MRSWRIDLMGRIARLALTVALGAAIACQPAAAPTATSAAPQATATRSAPTPTSGATPPPAVQTPAATPNPFAGVRGIVDADNHGWPREVEGLNGRVTIPSKPARIITASVGHDEMTLALVPAERLVGVGNASKSELYSNVWDKVQDVPEISSDPETIIAQDPDVVVTSPFLRMETVQALANVGVPVVQTELSNDPDSRIGDILLLGYIYGEEERALALAEEVARRYEAVASVTRAKPQSERQRVLALTKFADQVWTAGTNSTEGSIIEAAGGVNAAAEAGIEQNATTSLEGIIAMAPDVIFIPQPAQPDGEPFRQELLSDPTLAETPAIENGRVYLVDGKSFTTLSFWNIRGVEELAKLLWPEDFASLDPSKPFSFPE